MSRRLVLIGAMAPLILVGAPVRADWRSPIAGAPTILPSRFTPQHFDVLAPVVATLPPPPQITGAPTEPAAVPQWTLPLFDRSLSDTEKAEPLDGGLVEAITRIEPMYDPTRLDGTGVARPLQVSAGSAVMSDVFGERWRRLDLDANVDAKTSPIALGWHSKDRRPPCDAFTKARAHGFEAPALTALDATDCAALQLQAARAYGDQPAGPVVSAWISVPVFAAPLPGSRMSSADFWAARRAKIEEIQARLRRKWQDGAAPAASPLAEVVLRP